MEIIKILINGRPQGVYAITKTEDVTDALLDLMNEYKDNPDFTKAIIETHLKKGLCIIPKNEVPFEWNESLHGKFI